MRTADITGMPLDFYFRMDQGERMLQRYAAYQGARIQRIDHINCFTPDVQASYDFYTELGFRLTEYTETDDTRDPKLWAVWLHRKGNVHDLAFTNGRGPRLHHIGVWTAGPLDILHICDVMATSGYLPNMERGPGRHGISNAFFLYIRDPDGHRIELFTSDYLTVDPDLEPLRWSLTDPQRQTLWGHPAPKSWFEEGSEFSSRAGARAGAGGAADRGAVNSVVATCSAVTPGLDPGVHVFLSACKKLDGRSSRQTWTGRCPSEGGEIAAIASSILNRDLGAAGPAGHHRSRRDRLPDLFQPRRGADPSLRTAGRNPERRGRRHVRQVERRCGAVAQGGESDLRGATADEGTALIR